MVPNFVYSPHEYPFVGDDCEFEQTASCFIKNCENGGTCYMVKPDNEEKCFCKEGYSGEFCEITPCSSQPCLNGGQCLFYENSYICNCQNGFTGDNCEISP